MHSTSSDETNAADSAVIETATETAFVDAQHSDDERSEGLRERKKRERGQALRRAAIDLALENGYSNVTIEDICARCNVSRRTFFNYFKSKEEALLGRDDTVFDDEDQPDIEAFEAGGPTGRLIADLQHLLASVVRTRLNKREEMHQYHQLMKQDPSLMQAQMARMGNNERLFREMIQRRLDGGTLAAVGPQADENTRDTSATVSSGGAESSGDVEPTAGDTDSDACRADVGVPVSTRAEALAALAMMAIKATFMRLRRVEGDPAPVIKELFDELQNIFEEESA